MRAVLDSNVLISALISAGSPPDFIYRAWRKGRFTLVTSSAQLAELQRASRYPKLQKLVPAREFRFLEYRPKSRTPTSPDSNAVSSLWHLRKTPSPHGQSLWQSAQAGARDGT